MYKNRNPIKTSKFDMQMKKKIYKKAISYNLYPMKKLKVINKA